MHLLFGHLLLSPEMEGRVADEVAARTGNAPTARESNAAPQTKAVLARRSR